MRLALGLDAAWTATEPSGVALAGETGAGWRLLAVAASYGIFCGRDELRGEAPDAAALLAACERIAGRRPDMIAVDMPLARTPIVGRRESDLAISRAFGAAKAATHSPSALRPGALADKLRADFEAEGYALGTAEGLLAPGLIEVYPHAALIALTGDKVRLEYKAGKTTIYWPEASLLERQARVRAVWRRIVAALEQEIGGVAEALPVPGDETRGRALKGYEDRLDAVVCAYAAIAALEGRARAFGDEASAIWVPIGSMSEKLVKVHDLEAK